MSLTVYGASDDLIEVEGDVDEEFNVNCEDPHYLVTSNGVCLKITYTGEWKLQLIAGPATITSCPPDDEDNYSDVAEIDGEVKWVVLGEMVRSA